MTARALHHFSPRHDRPFIPVNCAGLAEGLLASQLFGHRRGAFAGAVTDQISLFEAAQGGMIFWDEIGEMPLGVQTQLLRVLQEQALTRLGETRPRKIDARIITATNCDLLQGVAAGSFRPDLFYKPVCPSTQRITPLDAAKKKLRQICSCRSRRCKRHHQVFRKIVAYKPRARRARSPARTL